MATTMTKNNIVDAYKSNKTDHKTTMCLKEKRGEGKIREANATCRGDNRLLWARQI